jgi:hypothetical protein
MHNNEYIEKILRFLPEFECLNPEIIVFLFQGLVIVENKFKYNRCLSVSMCITSINNTTIHNRHIAVHQNDCIGAMCRVCIFGQSQPAKNRNLIRLISNLIRVNWSSERNSVYCFSTVFTLLQQQEVLVYPVIFPV